MNWKEALVSAIIGAVAGLLLDEIVLRGKTRIAVARNAKKYFTVGKSKIGVGNWTIKGDK